MKSRLLQHHLGPSFHIHSLQEPPMGNHRHTQNSNVALPRDRPLSYRADESHRPRQSANCPSMHYSHAKRSGGVVRIQCRMREEHPAHGLHRTAHPAVG